MQRKRDCPLRLNSTRQRKKKSQRNRERDAADRSVGLAVQSSARTYRYQLIEDEIDLQKQGCERSRWKAYSDPEERDLHPPQWRSASLPANEHNFISSSQNFS